MKRLRAWMFRLGGVFRTERQEQELAAEMESHLQMHIDDNLRRGMTPEQARRDAILKLGGVEQTKQAYRERSTVPFLENLLRDVRYALRQLRKSPGFTITAVLTLALGIGATTAIFTLVHAVLLKSLPVTKPSELYRIGDKEDCCYNDGLQKDWDLFSYNQYKYFLNNTSGFSELAAFQASDSQIAVRRSDSKEMSTSFHAEFVSGNYFSMFGIGAYEGRIFAPMDDHAGAEPVAVMSYRTWQQKYGHDSKIIGASFMVNGHPFTIVGIAPPGFFGDRVASEPPSFWIPLTKEPLLMATGSVLNQPTIDWLDIIGRIQPAANPKYIEAQMQVELRQWLLSPMSGLTARLRARVPQQELHLSPGGAGVQQMQDEYRDGLRMLLWISSFVLLIVCANLANLMLVRATARKQQTSVQAALGASRSRLVRQALTESIVLAIIGGMAGLAFAYAGTHLILSLAFTKGHVPISAAPSLPVLGFAFAMSLLTGALFGTAPAWITANTEPVEVLRGATRATGHSGTFAQKFLVAAQVAMSVVLLGAAGLLTTSLRNMQHQRFGFDMSNRYILHIDPQMAGYKLDQLDAFYRTLHDTLAKIPEVASVSYSMWSPMDGNTWSGTIYIEGLDAPAIQGSYDNVGWDRISADYFSTLGTKIVAGRPIIEQDTATSRHVAVVNQTFANRFFPGQNAIGKHCGRGGQKHAGDFEIVGVVEDAQYWWPARTMQPMLFTPVNQHTIYHDPTAAVDEDRASYVGTIELRTRGDVPNIESQIHRALSQVNPNLSVIDFQTFAEQVKATLIEQTMIAQLVSLFGVLALALASIGLYGVTAYLVTKRTNEIGIRMALGANRLMVLKLVLRAAFLQVAIGLAVGIPAAILAGRAIANLLFGVKPYDPFILAMTAFLLGFAALIAALIPARRAASIDPMQALRAE